MRKEFIVLEEKILSNDPVAQHTIWNLTGYIISNDKISSFLRPFTYACLKDGFVKAYEILGMVSGSLDDSDIIGAYKISSYETCENIGMDCYPDSNLINMIRRQVKENIRTFLKISEIYGVCV